MFGSYCGYISVSGDVCSLIKVAADVSCSFKMLVLADVSRIDMHVYIYVYMYIYILGTVPNQPVFDSPEKIGR